MKTQCLTERCGRWKATPMQGVKMIMVIMMAMTIKMIGHVDVDDSSCDEWIVMRPVQGWIIFSKFVGHRQYFLTGFCLTFSLVLLNHCFFVLEKFSRYFLASLQSAACSDLFPARSHSPGPSMAIPMSSRPSRPSSSPSSSPSSPPSPIPSSPPPSTPSPLPSLS